MANLFAQAASVGPAPIVTFRAGKMYKQGTTVSPDPRKGQVSVIYSHSDQLTHFQWKDRFSGSVEDDLIIFPEEAKFTKVDKARGGRVFILDFKDQPDRQLFFWMQEPKDEKDAEFVEKINRALNEPGGASAMQSTADAASSATPAANSQQAALAGMLASMRQQGGQARSGQAPAATAQPASSAPRPGPPAADLAALANALTNALGVQVPVQPGAPTAGPGTAAARPAAPTGGAAGRTGPSPAELQMLQNMFSQAQRPAGQAQQQTQPQQVPIDLNHVLNSPEAQAAIRENAAQLVSELSEHLPPRPDDTTGEEHLLNNLRSAQFRQTADILNAALSDPAAYHEVTTAFQLPQDAAASGFGVAPFLQRVQRLAPAPQQQSSTQAAGQQEGQQSQGDAPAQSNDDKMQE